jgi:hypothetical protein
MGRRCIPFTGLRHGTQRQNRGLCLMRRRAQNGDNTSLGNADIHVAQAMYGAFILWQKG